MIDPLLAIIVAINIVFTGYKLIRESIGGLMHETNPEVLKIISSLLIYMKMDYWIDLHEFRYWQSDERTFMDFHLILPILQLSNHIKKRRELTMN